MRNPEIIIVPALFITIGFIVWVIVTGRQGRQRLKLVTAALGLLNPPKNRGARD